MTESRRDSGQPDDRVDADVVIVGGGPAGTTVASLLRKYMPELRVLILEKEKFPRDHIGESQLPPLCAILNEMGVWDKIEAAEFPIKIGAAYTWGRDQDRWNFDFYPVELWEDQPRPGQYCDQRLFTAFQVDRAKYDEILLRHAESLGAEVREQTQVAEVLHEGDRITALRLRGGEVIRGRYYVDGSGSVELFRRALGIGTEEPPQLRNIAVWDYWDDAEWAEEIGVGATRIQIRSLPWGWIWFIPIGPTRASVGVVCPAEHFRKSGQTVDELYHDAISSQSEIQVLLRQATQRGSVESCKDWSHLADRIVGGNWFLCGEAAGFADPILSAGMTLAHGSGREAAYIIMEMERGELDAGWLRRQYDERNRNAIRQHIRFALYWYSANSCFSDLKEHCSEIARSAGLQLTPNQAWRWLSVGGFSNDALGRAVAGSFDVASIKQILELFDGDRKAEWLVNGYNVFKLNLRNATEGKVGQMADGRIHMVDCYERGTRTLPMTGYFREVMDILLQTSDGARIVDMIEKKVAAAPAEIRRSLSSRYIQALEIMVQEGWVSRKRNRKRPVIGVDNVGQRFIRLQRDVESSLKEAGKSIRSRI